MKPANPERLAFLVYIWRENENAPNQSVTRETLVQVVRVADGEKHYFASLEEMVEHIRSHWLRQIRKSVEKK